MQTAFIDESGYVANWEKGIDEQPFYTLSAISLPADQVSHMYEGARHAIGTFALPGKPGTLGHGFEIKARDIARGNGWWGKHETERNSMRQLMLSLPAKYSGSALLVVVDKQKHLDQYAYPENPYMLALKFMFERLQAIAKEKNDYVQCIYDHNTRLDAEIQSSKATLVRDGSLIEHYSTYSGEFRSTTQQLDRILDVSFGESRNSIGLQVADFYATFTYQYYKRGEPPACGWWDTLYANLYRYNSKVDGWGLKVFP